MTSGRQFLIGHTLFVLETFYASELVGKTTFCALKPPDLIYYYTAGAFLLWSEIGKNQLDEFWGGVLTKNPFKNKFCEKQNIQNSPVVYFFHETLIFYVYSFSFVKV